MNKQLYTEPSIPKSYDYIIEKHEDYFILGTYGGIFIRYFFNINAIMLYLKKLKIKHTVWFLAEDETLTRLEIH